MRNKWLKYIMFFVLASMIGLSGTFVFAETPKRCVVIDPAHGGEDSGVIGVDKTAEKDVTLDIARLIQKELSAQSDIEVILTRNADKTVSLSERKKNIEAANPAVVLSIHTNGGFSKTASGYELYYPGFKDIDDPSKRNAAKIRKDEYLNNTVKLARLVQRNLDKLFPRKGRGLREAETPLTEMLQRSVLVVEIGFVTNPDEKKTIVKEKTEAEIAKALAKSIKSYF